MREQIKKGMGFGIGLAIIGVLGLAGSLLAQTLYRFSAGDLISASQINANFEALRGEVTAIHTQKVPVGTIVAWHKSLADTPAIPAGWVECNGQTLSDAASPYDGQTIPDLNNGGRFLRGANVSGVFQDDQMQGHKHDDEGHSHSVAMWGGTEEIGGAWDRLVHSRWRDPGGSVTTGSEKAKLGNPTETGYGTPRYGTETRPTNMSVIWIMRVK